MSQILLLLFFCVYSIHTATIQWTGTYDNNWWNPDNWDCDRDSCLPTSEDDVVLSPTQCNPSCIQKVLLPVPQAECRSLQLQSDSSFQFSLEILSSLSVGSGGVYTDKTSTITVFGKLFSVGNVQADGTFLIQSGEVHGPGNYSLYKLIASTSFLYAHVKVSTDLIVGPQAPGLADAILIQPNATLTVTGNLITDFPITISGILSVNSSAIFSSQNESYRYALTGNLAQYFGNINISAGLLMATCPIMIQSLYVGVNARLEIFYDSMIGNAKGSGTINVLNGNVGIDVTDSELQVTSTGSITITGNSLGNIVINGGDLSTILKGGSIFNINNLTVVRGYLYLENVSVKQLFLGDGVVIQKGSLNVTNRAVSTGAITIYQSILVIEKEATFEQLNGQFQLFGESIDSTPALINEGLYYLKGDLKSYVYVVGNGFWNVEGSWFIGYNCNITGTINLVGNTTTITFDNQNWNYVVGTVQNGGFLGSGGNFTAQQLSVNWVDEQFTQSVVESVSVVKSYYSHCCGKRKIGTLSAELLDLEPGYYPFIVGKGLINTVRLKDGVDLEFEQSADITNLEFSGGVLSSNGLTVSVRNTTYLTSDSLKVIAEDTMLETIILDCRGCSLASCNLDGWSRIKTITTRGRCALQSDINFLN